MLTYPEINRAMRAGATGGSGGVGGLARFGRGQILCAPEGDGGGGGTIAPAGGSQLDQTMINTINAAVSSQLDRKLTAAVEKLPLQQLISQGIANALPSALEGVTSKLSETLGAQIAKIGTPAPGGEGDAAGKGNGKGKAGAGENEVLIKLQTQMDELTKTIADKDRQLAAQAAEQADARMVDGARSAFLKAGVKEPMIDAVIALHKARGTFKQDKDGPHVVAKRKSSHGEYTERLDVDKFAAEWVGSDEGKHYIPATGTQRPPRRGADQIVAGGSGGERVLRGNGPNERQAPTQHEKQESDRAVGEMLVEALYGDPG